MLLDRDVVVDSSDESAVEEHLANDRDLRELYVQSLEKLDISLVCDIAFAEFRGTKVHVSVLLSAVFLIAHIRARRTDCLAACFISSLLSYVHPRKSTIRCVRPFATSSFNPLPQCWVCC